MIRNPRILAVALAVVVSAAAMAAGAADDAPAGANSTPATGFGASFKQKALAVGAAVK